MPERGPANRRSSPPPAVRALAAACLLTGLLLVSADVAGCAWPTPEVRSAVRAVMATSCHQRPDRSFRLAGRPFPACARCTGLHGAPLVAGLALLAPWPAGVRRLRARALVLAAAAVMGLDVIAGAVVPSWDWPVLRAATGLALGVAIVASVRAAPASTTGPRREESDGSG